MRVCVVGSGGREHALAKTLSMTASVIVAPGNAGMQLLDGLECSEQLPETIEADLFVIGPEAPLVDGLADRLRSAGHLVFGPGADGAQIEGSKAWMKQLLITAGVPTATYREFDQILPACAYLRSSPGPYVIKTDRLANGYGVLVTEDLQEAIYDATAKLEGKVFGAAGHRIVIEQYLSGPEVSVVAICDGTRAVVLPVATDYKRLSSDPTSPNTGGMGAYRPIRDEGDIASVVMDQAILPTLWAMCKQGIDYRGALYAGVVLTPEGPRILEFNARFADPETQVIMPDWGGDLALMLAAAAAGDLRGVDMPAPQAQAAVCVVLANQGYPRHPQGGDVIYGLAEAAAQPGICVYTAGVVDGASGDLFTKGGRVANIVGLGDSVEAARHRAYTAVAMVHWPHKYCRPDIADSDRKTP